MTLLAPPLNRTASDLDRGTLDALGAQLSELDQHLADQHRRLLGELQSLTIDADMSDLLDDDVAAGCGTERDTTWLLACHVAARRAEIAAARRRLADGTYGRCSACGESISPQRLEVLPAAATCVRCAR